MAIPFAGIGLGLEGISALAGLLGANSARKKAEEARNSYLLQLRNDNAREYLDVVEGNARSLQARAGGLNDALVSTGRSLGSANAAAGVTNNSAVAGSLALGSQGISQSLADFAAQNSIGQRRLLDQQQGQASGMQLGAANQDLGYAQDQFAGSADAFGNFLGGLSQFGQGAPSSGSPLQIGGGGFQDTSLTRSQALGIANGIAGGMNGGGEQTTGGMDLPQIGRGVQMNATSPVNPGQSMIQSLTQKNRRGLGGIDIRTMGDMTNGGQGMQLPGAAY